MAVLLSLRLFLAFTHAPYLGIDGGAYVLSALDVQSQNQTSVGFSRPPLAPGWGLVPFIWAFGVDDGYKLWTVAFSVLPLLPVYLLTRTLVNKSAAIFALAFMSVDMMQMEMMVTGSLPLIGFAFIGLAIWAIFKMTHEWFRWRYWLTLVASVAILPYVNQTAAGIGAIILPLTVICCWIFSKKQLGEVGSGPKRVNLIVFVLPAAFLGFLIGLGSLPWYLANAPGNAELRFPGPILQFVHWLDPALLLQFPLVCVLIYYLRKETTDYRMRTIGVLLGVLGVMILFLSWDEALINILYRSRYFLAVLVYPAIAFLLCRTFPLLPSFRQEWATILPMTACWLALLWGQVVVFNLQTGFKDMVYPETVRALEIAKAEHPDKAIISNAYSLSHWIAAINQVESPNTWSVEPSPYYKKSDYRVRCVLGWVADCDAQAATRALNAGYILIDEKFPDNIGSPPVYGAPTEDEWANLADVPWLRLKFAQGSVKLWEIRF